MFYDIYVVNRDDEKEKKDEKSYKSVFEQFGISKPTLQMNPFTGKSIPTSIPLLCSWKKLTNCKGACELMLVWGFALLHWWYRAMAIIEGDALEYDGQTYLIFGAR